MFFNKFWSFLVTLVQGQVKHLAGTSTHLLVHRVDQLRKGGQRRADVFEAGLRLATAKVGQRPRGVSEHRQLGPVRELLKEGAHRALLEH